MLHEIIVSVDSLVKNKIDHLEGRNMQVTGVIMSEIMSGDNKCRATIDSFGKVQWWHIDGSGTMIYESEQK
jgi:hypothetical protein